MRNNKVDELDDTQDFEIKSLLVAAAETVLPRPDRREAIYSRVLAEARKHASARTRGMFGLPRLRPVWSRALVVAAILLLLLGFGLWRVSPPPSNAGTLTVHSGSVTLNRMGRGWARTMAQTAHVGDHLALKVGDEVTTDIGAWARIDLFEGSSVELGETSRLSLEAAEPAHGDIPPKIVLRLWRGHTTHRVVTTQWIPNYRVETPLLHVTVRGTLFDLFVPSEDRTYIRCDEGAVGVVLGDQTATVRAGEEMSAIVGQPLYARPQQPPKPQIDGGGTTIITRADVIEVSGTARPHGRVVVYVDETAVANIDADMKGHFHYNFAPAEDGEYALQVVEIVAGGVASEPSEPLIIRCDRTRPSLRITHPLSPEVSSDSTLLAGETEPGAIVTVNNNKVPVNTNGHFAVNLPLKVGENETVVTASDEAGNSLRFQMVIVRR